MQRSSIIFDGAWNNDRHTEHEPMTERPASGTVDFAALDKKLDAFTSELQQSQPSISFDTFRFSFDLSAAKELNPRVILAAIEQDRKSTAPNTSVALPLRSTSLPKSADVAAEGNIDVEVTNKQVVPQSRNPKLARLVRPLPIVVPANEVPQEVQSAGLPDRSVTRGVLLRSVSDDGSRIKSHRRHVTISEGRGSARKTLLLSTPLGQFIEDVPPLPGLSPSNSTTTATWTPPPTPPLVEDQVNEDRIRREMELFTLQDGAEPLVGNKYRHRKPPRLQLDSDDEISKQPSNNVQAQPRAKKVVEDDQKSMVSTKSMGRRKSIFSKFQRSNEVDSLLDLYFDDTASTKKTDLARRPSLAKRMTRSFRKPAEDVPDLPPLPQLPPLKRNGWF